MRGGVNFVNTTVRLSGVKVEAKTSPVETMPSANITAGVPGAGIPGSVSEGARAIVRAAWQPVRQVAPITNTRRMRRNLATSTDAHEEKVLNCPFSLGVQQAPTCPEFVLVRWGRDARG